MLFWVVKTLAADKRPGNGKVAGNSDNEFTWAVPRHSLPTHKYAERPVRLDPRRPVEEASVGENLVSRRQPPPVRHPDACGTLRAVFDVDVGNPFFPSCWGAGDI